MTRFRATRNGQVPFTTTEEAAADITQVPTLDDRLTELRLYRKQKEFGGFTLSNGTFICTEPEDQRRIDGAVLGARLDQTVIIDYKTPDGFVELDADTMIGIGQALFTFIQACFTRERQLIDALRSDITTDITTGWPT